MSKETFECYENGIPDTIGQDVKFLGKSFPVEVRLSPPHPKYGYSYRLMVFIETCGWGFGNLLSVDTSSGTNTHPDEFVRMMKVFVLDDSGKKWYWVGMK